MNSKGENYEDFCLDFVQEFGLSSKFGTINKRLHRYRENTQGLEGYSNDGSLEFLCGEV